MKILFLGDIVSKVGRDIIFTYLDKIKEEEGIDFTVVNGENSAHGKGITHKIYERFKSWGIDAITLGNHAFSKKEIIDHLDECPDLIVPYNYPSGRENRQRVYEINGLRLCIANILGSAFMMENTMSAFEAMEEILYKYDADLYLVDLHAEATAEKILFGHHFSKRLIATLGTHTHVQTADERLIDGMAYISDVGMNGVYDSIIGRDIEEMERAMIKGEKTRFTLGEGPGILCAVVVTVDEQTKRATAIKRLQIRPENVV